MHYSRKWLADDAMKLLNPMPSYNLFGIEDQDFKKAKIVAIPVPYDATVTYRAGTRDGPHAIIEASRQIEFYSEETGIDISRVGIFTTEELAPDLSSPENMAKRVEKEVTHVLDGKKIPLLIGGEHSISIGAIRAVSKTSRNFSVLHFDAHSDSRDEYLGSKYCHACVMARAREVCKSCYSVGIRSVTEEAAKKFDKQTLYMKDMRKMKTDDIVEAIVQNTNREIYLTIDLDVLDPSEMPSVGTPEPDGLKFYELKEILKGVLKSRKILGMDFVELCPIPGLVAPNYLAAKLIYLTIGYSGF